MRIGRRPLFFFILAAICLALVFPTPSEFRLVNLAMAGLAIFWAILLALEELSGIKDANRRAKPDQGRRGDRPND
jgi:hypothetical protein